MGNFIKWLDEIRLEDYLLVGNKCASLGELNRISITTPILFCVTTNAYRDFIDANNLKLEIENLLINIDFDDLINLGLATERIRQIILQNKIPENIVHEIFLAYDKLCYKYHEENTKVSIRSSGTAEDNPNDSFAGQYCTSLNIKGKEDIINNVKECWASVFSKHALFYTKKKGYNHSDIMMAVIIQKMMPANISGVLFTESPSGNELEMVVNATWGLGEPIVSGKTISDHFMISRETSEIISQHIEQKEKMVVCGINGGIESINVSEDKRKITTLTNEKIKTLVEIGKKVEGHLKSPSDIEWIFIDNNLMVLQARPITTLHQLRTLPKFPIEWETNSDKEIIWTRGMGVPARFVDPVTTLSFELVKKILSGCWESAMKKLPLPYKVGNVQFRLFNSYLYWNINLSEKPKFSWRFLYFIYKLWIALRTGIDGWNNYIPTYMKELEQLKKVNITELETHDLYEHFERICTLFSNYFVWEVYLGETIDVFFDIFLDVNSKLTKEPKIQIAKLVQGIDNRTLEMNRNLYKLVSVAKENNQIMNLILMNLSFEETIEEIKRKNISTDFLCYFHSFIEKYGHRSPKPDWYFPSWKDEPGIILNNIRERLKINDKADDIFINNQIEEREKLTESLYNKVRKNPLKRVVFSWFTKKARQWTPMREDRQHYVKFASQLLKETLAELNSRLIDNYIATDVKDIFFLKLNEIKSIIEDINNPRNKLLRKVIDDRKKKWEEDANLVPPAKITNQTIENYIITEGGKLIGVPCSPGRIIGKARVLSNPSDFNKIEHGEILVAPETGPEWIFIFGLINGIVTDYGMPLSHSALLAREFNIPAVSGTKIATGVIKTGQVVIVDGTSGIIRML